MSKGQNAEQNFDCDAEVPECLIPSGGVGMPKALNTELCWIQLLPAGSVWVVGKYSKLRIPIWHSGPHDMGIQNPHLPPAPPMRYVTSDHVTIRKWWKQAFKASVSQKYLCNTTLFMHKWYRWHGDLLCRL